jgi:hypothetical protein
VTSARVLLAVGALVPVLYFGAQVVAGMQTPDYDWLVRAASDLGADGMPAAGVFNALALATGVAALCGGAGLVLGHRAARIHWAVATLAAFALAGLAAGAINAFLNPLPSPAHDPGPWAAPAFLIPTLSVFAVLPWHRRPRLTFYLALNTVAFGVVAAIMSGTVGTEFRDAMPGLMQRFAAATMFLPAGVVCGWAALEQGRR